MLGCDCDYERNPYADSRNFGEDERNPCEDLRNFCVDEGNLCEDERNPYEDEGNLCEDARNFYECHDPRGNACENENGEDFEVTKNAGDDGESADDQDDGISFCDSPSARFSLGTFEHALRS